MLQAILKKVRLLWCCGAPFESDCSRRRRRELELPLQAKAERHSFKKKIKSTDEKLQQERKKIEQVSCWQGTPILHPLTQLYRLYSQEEVRFQVDREIFAKILKVSRWFL